MVDRIKFIVDNANLSHIVLNEHFFGPINSKGVKIYYYKNNQNVDEEDDENKLITYNDYDSKYKKNFYIKYYVYDKPRGLASNQNAKIGNQLIVHRNFRKEFYGEARIDDLDYKKFKELICRYAAKFQIDESRMLKARVTKVEFGVTLRLKSDMEAIIPCFVSCENLPEKVMYGNTGVTFIGGNYSVSFYDKLKRILDSRAMMKNQKRRAIHEPIVRKNNFWLRYEIKIEKVSGFNFGNYKDSMSTLKKILDNWNALGDMLYKMYGNVEFVDFLSPQIEVDIKGKSYGELDKLMTFTGIKTVGEKEFFTQFIPMLNKNKQSFFRGHYKIFYEGYVEKSKNGYSKILDKALLKKIDKLKNKI